MRMRPPAGLHGGDLLGVVDVRDVEDANAAEPLLAHGVRRALTAAVEPASRLLHGEEEQVPVESRVALTSGALELASQLWVVRIGDVPHLESVKPTLHDDVALEREVSVQKREVTGIRRIVEALGLLAAPEKLHSARGLLRVPPSRPQTHAGIRLTQRREDAQRNGNRGSS